MSLREGLRMSAEGGFIHEKEVPPFWWLSLLFGGTVTVQGYEPGRVRLGQMIVYKERKKFLKKTLTKLFT
jgi:hypothetical protein